MDLSKRGELAPFSPIRKLSPLAEEAKKDGVKVYHLNIGQPDLKVPEVVKSAIKHCSIDYLPYTGSQGYPPLLEGWQRYYSQIGLQVLEEDILVTFGASEGLVMAMAAVCDPIDELIVFEPYYANYKGFANLVSAKVVPVELERSRGYHLPKKDIIEKAITKKTKAILFTNPNNPSGTVFTKEEIELLIQIANKNSIFLISDETYFGLTFDGRKSISALHIAKGETQKNIIILDSMSKRLNLCGARIGTIVSKNKELMGVINRFSQERLSVGILDQIISAPVLNNCLPYINDIAKIYQKRRDVFIKELEKGLDCQIHYPEGAFYTMLKLPFSDADEFARWLLQEFRYNNETVMVAPGSGFYASGKGKDEIRVAYVLDEEELLKAAKILVLAIKEYKDKKGKNEH